jgi:hypothetical protein
MVFVAIAQLDGDYAKTYSDVGCAIGGGFNLASPPNQRLGVLKAIVCSGAS